MKKICGLGIAALWLCLSAVSGAQETQPSLGDLARKTRKEQASPSHIPAKQVSNEDQDGPDAAGVWRLQPCTAYGCGDFSIGLPKTPRWIRPEAEPRPVLIPLAGREDDLSHAIRVYAAESLHPREGSFQGAKRSFLQELFSRPEYFGHPARLINDEPATPSHGEMHISHFVITTDHDNYRGSSVIVSSGFGAYGFACVFRDEDSSAASSMCDGIVKSARDLSPYGTTRRSAPRYDDPPPTYRRKDDPPSDDPEENDPTEDPAQVDPELP